MNESVIMGTYEKGNERKKKLILETYRKLLVKDASEITIREIAEACKCSAAGIYSHYKGIEHLIMLASIKIYENYLIEYTNLVAVFDDPIEQYVAGWKLFNKYAFERPDIYYRMMLDSDQCIVKYSEALMEYMRLFSFDRSISAQALYYTLLFTDSITEVDKMVLQRAVNRGNLSLADMEYYSKSNPLLVKGMLESALTMNQEQRKQAELECDNLILRNLEKVYKEK